MFSGCFFFKSYFFIFDHDRAHRFFLSLLFIGLAEITRNKFSLTVKVTLNN